MEKRTGEVAPESISVIFVGLGRFTKEDDTQLTGEFESLCFLLKHVHTYEEIPERLMVGMNQYDTDMMNEMDYAQISPKRCWRMGFPLRWRASARDLLPS